MGEGLVILVRMLAAADDTGLISAVAKMQEANARAGNGAAGIALVRADAGVVAAAERHRLLSTTTTVVGPMVIVTGAFVAVVRTVVVGVRAGAGARTV